MIMSAVPKVLRTVFVAAVLASLAALAERSNAEDAGMAYLHFSASSHDEFNSAVEFAEDQGVFLAHRFYPYSAIGTVPVGAAALLEGHAFIDKVYVDRVPDVDIFDMKPHETYLAQAFNNLFFSSGEAYNVLSTDTHAYLKTLTLPRRNIDETVAGESEPPPIAPAVCEFMLGHIVIGIIMPESNPVVGVLDWTESEEQLAVEESIAGAEWWRTNGPKNKVWFSYDINYRVPVDVEPMTMGDLEILDTWAGQSLGSMGYEGMDHVDQSYKYIEDLRRDFKADWGFISFILDGYEGASFGIYFAAAVHGGPYTVTINANSSAGPTNLDRIFALAMGSVFYCLAEYAEAPGSCLDRSGYLNVENGNKLRGGTSCKINVHCIMRHPTISTPLYEFGPCYYSQGVVGWWDEDGDGIPDILDTDPVVESVSVDTAGLGTAIREDTLFATKLSFSGTSEAVPIPNDNPISLNRFQDFTVERVRAEYRVNGGAWVPCEPVDGRFDNEREGFRFTASDLVPWFSNTIEVRAVTASGNVTPDSLVSTFEFFVAQSDPKSPYLVIFSPTPARPPVSIGFVPFDPSVSRGTLIVVEIAVFDVMGRKVRTLRSDRLPSGEFERAEWDGEDSGGNRVAAGVYFISVNSGGNSLAQKIIIIP